MRKILFTIFIIFISLSIVSYSQGETKSKDDKKIENKEKKNDTKISLKNLKSKNYCENLTSGTRTSGSITIYKKIDKEIRSKSKNLSKYFCLDKDNTKLFKKAFENKKKTLNDKKLNFDDTFLLKFEKSIKYKIPTDYIDFELADKKKIQILNATDIQVTQKLTEELTNFIVKINNKKEEYEKKFNDYNDKLMIFTKEFDAKILNLNNFVSSMPNPAPKDYAVKKDFVEKFLQNYKKKYDDLKLFEKKLAKNIDRYNKLIDEIEEKKTSLDNSKKNRKKIADYSRQEKDLNDIEKASKELESNLEKYLLNISELDKDSDDQIKYTVVEEKGFFESYGSYLVSVLSFIFFILFVVFLIMYLSTSKKVKELKDFQDKLLDQIDDLKKSSSQQFSNLASNLSRSNVSQRRASSLSRDSKKSESVKTNPYEEVISDYLNTLDNFELVASFLSKWKAKGFSRKERQDGGKTIIVPSQRSFEKAEIWVVDLQDQSIALPGIAVKQNMSTYMNLDFEKAQRDFRGIFDVASGSIFTCRMNAKLQKIGPTYVVSQKGKIEFPG